MRPRHAVNRAGSSPRMWGTLIASSLRPQYIRFIPTHVGNTLPSYIKSGNESVHPHACGEHNFTFFTGKYSIGSSPRMWGTLFPCILRTHASRFIPTHVGNTDLNPQPGLTQPVHPHACGEHPSGKPFFPVHLGSSPRMWGTLLRRAHALPLFRFIPTHVGNTC